LQDEPGRRLNGVDGVAEVELDVLGLGVVEVSRTTSADFNLRVRSRLVMRVPGADAVTTPRPRSLSGTVVDLGKCGDERAAPESDALAVRATANCRRAPPY
jgi:hypothetical protein